MQKNFGVTLIELVVILGILILLTALAVPTFIFFQTETDLNNSTEEIINTLRVAQNKTLGSEGASNYGVHFESDKLVLFKGTSYDSLAIDNEVHSLPKRVEIYEINLLGGGLEVIFNKIVGATSQPGNINLRLEGEVTKIRTIGIQSSGKITLGQEANPIALPQKDSRHVHFNLGWPIQSATTLKFYFPAIPQTELVDMANYFNAGKTEFDWDNENS
ncbi:MAG: hypothetical protein Q8N73_02100, partial [bacterium]|nr:hypothetical protein [bacterium]